jgi:Flp pilus assembly protein TadD
MRLRAALPLVALAAALPAASVGLSAPGGVTRVVQVQAVRRDIDPLGLAMDAQFRASYYYCLAQLAELSGQPAEAAEALQRALGADPGSALLLREQAGQLEAAGQDAKAVVLWQAQLDAQPGDIDLRRHVGRLYLRLGRDGEARQLFLKRDGSDPTDPAWLRSLVAMDLVQDDLAGAQRRLEALLAQGDDKDDRELLGLTLLRRGRYAQAAQQYQQVLKADPARSDAWARLSACHEAAGDSGSARHDLELGLAAVPDSRLLQEGLAKLCYRLGDYAAAEAGFDRLVQADPKDGSAWMLRGLARLKTQRYADAEADFTQLGLLKPGDPGQGYALALAQILQKKFAPAEAQLKRVLAEDPQAEPAWIQLAYLYERQGRLDRSRATLAQARQAIPKSEDLTLLQAASYEDAGDLKGAETLLRAALKAGPRPALRFQLAVILDKQGSFPKAEAELMELIASDPKHAQALNYLGYSWADRGEKLDQAEMMIRRALEVEPDNHYYLDSLGWVLHRRQRDHEALEALLKASQGLQGSGDADEAVVFDHLAEVQQALGHALESDRAHDQARLIRERAKDRPDDAVERLEKESGL